MRYELWHIASGNLMDDFESEAEALAAARAYLTPDEGGVVVDVAVMVYSASGQEPRSLHGPELAALVFGSTHAPIQQSA